jgi:LPS-assembly protein
LKIHADSLTYEKADETYRARGNVHLEWDGTKLTSDSALFRQAENTAEAEGGVVLTKVDDILRADRLKLNVETEKGEITNGYIFMKKGNFHLRGQKMEKMGAEDYRVEKGSFTLCDGDVPSWKFSANSLDVTLGEYATGRNVLFYIRDVPVFYLPYLIFPVKRERQSGFLFPKFGTSTEKGLNFIIPYYWAISPSQDLTATLDIQSKRGVGTEADYRYIRKSGSEGSFRGYLIYDTDLDKFRGDLSERHQEDFSPTLFFKSDINYVSDRNFYRDYAEPFEDYSRKSVDSNVFLTKHWSRFLLTPEVRFSQNLEASNDETLQKLPIITFSGIKQRIAASPLYFALNSNFTNFYRQEGFQGQRIDVHPSLILYGRPLTGLEGSVWAGYQHRFYNMYGGSVSDSFSDAGGIDAGASLATTLARVYETGGARLKKLLHVMIPEVSYLYVQHSDEESLPFFDYNDRVVRRNMVNYSVTNYLTGKFADGDAVPQYRDLAYLKLSQGYEFNGKRRDLLTFYDELNPFSDIWIESKLNPTREISFLTDSRFNPYSSNFSTNNVALRYDDGGGNYLSAGYRFSRTELEYLESRVGISLVKPFLFTYIGRYSIDKGDVLESYYSLEYKKQCWSVTFSYREREDHQEFFISFALAGIGPLGKMRTF